ncbi:MAG: tripartite-type tricarboxylate transporter receptor subunit TctC [Alphaproteobacteria bacterium]|jgi:tripartite-type tricarboxylate transporter receptor subunit TctC
MKRLLVSAIGALSVLGFGAGMSGQVMADPVADFYKSARVKFIISAGTGGGYSTYSRTFIRWMSRYVPGKPTIRPQHMQGAGGIVAANYLYHRAKKDGSEMAMIHRGAVSTVPLYRKKGILYDPTKFSWIGSIDTSTSYCVSWHTSLIKTPDDLKNKAFIAGGLGPGANTDIFSHLLNNLFDTKIQLITGYGSGDAMNLAMERGEIQGRCSWSLASMRATRKKWLDEKKITFLLEIGLKPSNKVPGVPIITDFVKTKRQQQILELLLAAQLMGRPMLAPPGVPADRLAALRKAFDLTTQDPTFIKHMDTIGLGVSPLPGIEIDTLLKRIYATPKDVIIAAGQATKSQGKTKVTVKASAAVPAYKTTLTAVKRGGRELAFKGKDGSVHTAKISGSRSKIVIKGKKTKRKNLKVGMACAITYPGNGAEAKSVVCN